MRGQKRDEDARKRAYARASIFFEEILRRKMDCRVISAFTRVFRRAMPGNDDGEISIN
jgi:hypothetical protein